MKIHLNQLSYQIRCACRNNLFYTFLSPWQCGAFDGGCLMVAEALRRVIGLGEVWAMEGIPLSHPTAKPIWQHAVLKVGDWHADGDGLATEEGVRRRWREHEGVAVTGFTPILSLEAHSRQYDTPYSPEVVEHLAVFFDEQFGFLFRCER